MGKRILITGKNSYIGSKFCDFTTKYGNTVDTVDMIGEEWRNHDFSSYDVVVHVAAVVHQKENSVSKDEYFKVNTQLAAAVAKRAKDSGVSQFVFLSTMSVYGVLNGVIGKDTALNPFNEYGKSKLAAEKEISALKDSNFSVVIVRPPMVYGKGCKGNYVSLSKFAKKLPFFPMYNSQRSMIYIDNLSSFLQKAIDENLSGVFCPQDEEYVNTSMMVKAVAEENGKNIKLTKCFNPFITLALKMKINIVCKVFGSLIYEKDLCPEFSRVDLKTAIKHTEE